MRFAWIDLREVPRPQLQAVVDAAIHARMAGVVAADAELLGTLPPTVTRVLVTEDRGPVTTVAKKSGDKEPKGAEKDAKSPSAAATSPSNTAFDVLLRKFHTQDELDALAADHRAGTRTGSAGGTPVSGFIDVRDDRTLQLSCAGAMVLPYTVIHFADPTKIPLEIVLAAAESAEGKLVTVVDGLEEAAIVFDVLERGSDGILFTPRSADEVFALARLLEATTPQLELSTLTVESIRHVGLGDRVCVDTCSHFEEDEGILVGSYSSGFVLCCSETHPCPTCRPGRSGSTRAPCTRTRSAPTTAPTTSARSARAARCSRSAPTGAPGGSSSGGPNSSPGRCWRSVPTPRTADWSA